MRAKRREQIKQIDAASSLRSAMASIIIFLLILIFSSLLQISISTEDHCSSRSCNPEDGNIHFPFRLPEFNPDIHCGYDRNFTLSCSPSYNQTLLHLPNAGPFAIRTINYISQLLTVTDPKNCFPQLIFDGFDLSGSPFGALHTKKYTYYNCPSGSDRSSGITVPCMSGADYKVIVVSSYEARTLNNCTAIKTISAPAMNDIISGGTYVELEWYKPSCQECLFNDGICGLSNGHKVVCHSTNGHGVSDGVKYGLILGVTIPGMLILLIVARRCGRRSNANRLPQPPTETQLVQNQQQHVAVLTGLDRPTIESYPKFVLGDGDVLLEPNIGPCSICLSEYKESDSLRTIPDCNHYFHSDCVDEWLELNATCPVCRKVPDGL